MKITPVIEAVFALGAAAVFEINHGVPPAAEGASADWRDHWQGKA